MGSLLDELGLVTLANYDIMEAGSAAISEMVAGKMFPIPLGWKRRGTHSPRPPW